MHSLSYENRLKCLNLYSLQRRRDRYTAIYVWKIMEEIVPNLSPPMCVNVSERRGRLCVLKSVERGHIGTLAHSSFRWRGARIFNALPPNIRHLSNCDVLLFKRQLDNYLSLLPDFPCTPNTDNSITGAVVEDQSWCLQRDGLADWGISRIKPSKPSKVNNNSTTRH